MTDYLSILTLFFAFLYGIIGISINIGMRKKYRRSNVQPVVSVMIAARNEQKYLSACLNSLEFQNYPTNKFEVIILNDRSTDKTRDIALSFCNRLPNFRLHDVVEGHAQLKGKMNALSQGIDNSKGEIILVTDADCRVPTTWITEMTAYFTADVGLVGGPTILSREKNPASFFDRLQSMDWLFLQAIASGTAGIGLPVTVLGNNFGFKKAAYQKTGGFSNLGFSLTEDMALLKAIVKKTSYRIVYPLNSGIRIFSNPVNRWKDFYHQRSRWVSGGLYVILWGWILMLTSFIAHLLLVYNIAAANLAFTTGLGVVLILIVDYLLVESMIRKYEIKKLRIFFPVFEVFYILYTTLFAFMLFIPRHIKWKGRTY